MGVYSSIGRKNACCRALRGVTRSRGSHRMDVFARSASWACRGATTSDNGLHLLTRRSDLSVTLGGGQSSADPEQNFLALLAILLGNGPIIASTMAMCSKLSCVGKTMSPVYNSIRMQPNDHKSLEQFHPNCITTSGARYCRVWMTLAWWSSWKVAPPKSITFMSHLRGRRTVPAPRGFCTVVYSEPTSIMFSGFRSVCVSVMPWQNERASRSWPMSTWMSATNKPLYPLHFIKSSRL
mmetsp:Transcript_48245/g.109860  ORF Transcript_48245/g.109860 Transcript_48245/m.109860 type:complete len:238 (+) Transcript_48245:126-839(+)